MKYLLLIHQGDTPTPQPDAWARLSEDEQKAVYADYQAINATPGVTPGLWLQPPETATTVRVQDGQDADDRRAVRRRQGGARRLPRVRGRGPRRGDRARGAHSGGPAGRCDRGAPDHGGVVPLDQVFRDEWGRVLAGLIGFLGDFDLAEEAAQEAFAIAAERWPREGAPANPRAWLLTTGAQPRDRPHPPRPHARREDPAPRRAGSHGGRRGRDSRSRTSGSSSSSPAAIRRSRSTPRSR